jgi:hypothetical protein
MQYQRMLRAGSVLAAALILCCISHSPSAEEVTLYDATGAPVAYVDTEDEFTIYLWSGKPVAYLDDYSRGTASVWGFNGKHLGWFERGAIWGEDGNAACAIKEVFSGFVKFEAFKAFKEFKPSKSFKEFEPLKPLLFGRFGRVPCAVHLAWGQ